MDTHSSQPNVAFSPAMNRPDLEYQLMAQEILILLRRDLTQRELSEKLGYTFNQVGKWEAGATKMKWEDFFQLANVLEIPIEEHFRKLFYQIFDGEFTPVSALNRFLDTTGVDQTLWPEATVRRWIRGATSPLFSEVLRLLGTNPAMLISWLEPIVDCTKVSSLKEPYEAFLKRADLVLHDPVCVYLNAALSVQAYRDLPYHNDELLAEHSACTVEHVKQTLKAMIDLGIITYRDGKYLPCPIDFSFGTARNFKVRSLMKYSLDLLASRYLALPADMVTPYYSNPSMGGVRVVALSSNAAQKIAQEIVKFNNELAKIVLEDREPKDAVQAIVMNSVPSNINSPVRSALSRRRSTESQ